MSNCLITFSSIFASMPWLLLLLHLLWQAGPQRSTSFLFQIKLEFYFCYQCWVILPSTSWLLIENRWGSWTQHLCKQILCVMWISRLSLLDNIHALEKGTITCGRQTLEQPVHSYQISQLVTSDITGGSARQWWFCSATQSVTCDSAIQTVFHPVKNSPIQALHWVHHWSLPFPNKDLWSIFLSAAVCQVQLCPKCPCLSPQ